MATFWYFALLALMVTIFGPNSSHAINCYICMDGGTNVTCNNGSMTTCNSAEGVGACSTVRNVGTGIVRKACENTERATDRGYFRGDCSLPLPPSPPLGCYCTTDGCNCNAGDSGCNQNSAEKFHGWTGLRTTVAVISVTFSLVASSFIASN